MYVLDLGCGLGGASRYLAAECGCRVAAIDLTPNFVEAARILTARCGLAERIEFRQANALALPFPDSTFDHAWSYAVTMNIADKEGLGRQVASSETRRPLLMQRDRAKVRRNSSVSVALGKRRGFELPGEPGENAGRS